MPRPLRLLLAVLLLTVLPLPGRAQPAATADRAAEDEQLLKDARVSTEGPALLDFFRKRTPTDRERERAAVLIRRLGEDAFAVRQKAAEGLVALGPAALPQLRAVLNHPDEEVRQRAAECVQAIDPTPRGVLAAGAARRLRAARPAGAVPVLLAYLSSADDEAVTEEVLAALVVLGVRDGKVDPDLAGALQDRAPERRAAAALVVGRSGTADQRGAARALLTDADARVRFRAAQGLLAAREREALPALIALLAEGPRDVAEQADDLLRCAAAEQAPITPLGPGDVSRRLGRNAWAGWWKVHGKAVPLAARDVDVPLFNPTLQVRTAVRQFLSAISRGDLALFQKVTDVPFVMGGDQTFNGREQLDRFLLNLASDGQKGTYLVGPVVTLDAFVLRLPAEQRAPFLALRKPENRAAHVSYFADGKRQQSAVIVRLAGGRGQVIGVGPELAAQPLSR
jgi:HEAT repeat protein